MYRPTIFASMFPTGKELPIFSIPVLPRASEYHFVGNWSPARDWHFMSTCVVEGNGKKAIFSLSAEMGSARPWQQWAKAEIPPNSGGKVTYFNAGLKGVSNAQVAAIWVPCYASEESSKDPWSMTALSFGPGAS